MPSFPIILYPPSITQAQTDLPPLPALAKPQPPQRPKAPQPPPPAPQPLDLRLIGFGSGLSLVIVLGLLGVRSAWAMLALLTVAAVLGGTIWYNQVRLPTLRQEHQRQQQDYEQQKLAYQQEMKALPTKKAAHQAAMQQYEAQLAQLQAEHHTPEKVAAFRREQIQKALKQTRPHDGEQGTYAGAGRSEEELAERLKQHFGKKIRRRTTLEIPGTDHFYEPDFAYVNAAAGIYIDVEVDEPYVYNTGEPIHYIGKDDRRNQFFLERGWAVVRFSEEQVRKNADGCCKVLAQVVSELSGKKMILKGSISDLKPLPQWTKEEAERMALVRRREGYSVKNR